MSIQIMQSVQENELFSEMSCEESATLSGGGPVTGGWTSLYALNVAGPAAWGTRLLQGAIAASILDTTTT